MFVITCVLVFVCAGLLAQSISTSQIVGTIQDSSGSAIPDAQIVAIQTDTGLSRTTQSNVDGSYTLTNLPIGPYRIDVKKDGFSAYTQSGIVLQVASKPTIDVTLKVGAVSEKVQVTANATMVETQNSGVGQVVDQERVVDLPLNGRLATQLITLAGAAATVPQANSGQLSSAKNYPNEAVISVGGGMSNGLTYVMDGGTHNDPINNANLPLPFPDALQEFKVETSALPAQYGHHSSGAVNVVTKSGTNSYHGDLFEFLRNGDFNARDTFSPARDALKRSQFGATFGGPIKKDKLFFFAGYQGTIQHSAPTIGTSFIPTPAMLRGDFSAVASPSCNSGKQISLKNPATGVAFSGNQIPTALFSGPALKATTYYGSTTDPCGMVHFGSLANQAEHMGVSKLDYQLSSKQSIFVRHLITHFFAPSSYTGTPLSVTQPSPDDLVNSVVLGDTYVMSPTALNSFHATYNRSAIVKTQVPLFGAHDLGIQGVTELYPEYLSLNVTGALYTNGNGSNPGTNFTNTYQVADDISMLRGAHQIQFGGNYIGSGSNSIVLLAAAGAFTFNGSRSGLPMADFLLGVPSTFAQNMINQDYERYRYLAAYIQDSWKISRRLTANYGLRWEPYLGGARKFGWVSHFDRTLFDQNVRSSVYTNAPPGVLYPGDPGFDTNNHPSHAKWNDFAPRAGIVWDPQGNGKMTIRASAGIFYDLPHTLFFYNYANETPWGESITINTPPGGFANPWQGFPGGNPFPVTLSKSSAFPANEYFETVPLDVKVTYLEQWNLSIQRQIGKDWLASATYLGNNTIHLWTDRELNPAVYIPGTCAAGQYGLKAAGPCSTTTNISARKTLTLANPVQGPIFNSLELLDDGGTASYNALLVSLQHRLANNFTALANYTWSHCIADLATTELSGPMYTNPNDRRFDRGGCPGTDLRHVFNLSVVAQSPKFSQHLVDAVAGHWQIGVISNFRSGINFNATTGVDNALTGVATTAQRPNLVLASPYCADKGPGTCWLNGAAFAAPATGTFGNLGINSLVGPRYFDIDLSVSRAFQLREHIKLEVRGEAFNIQNRVNYNTPGVAQSVLGTAPVALNSTSFGKLLADVSPRIIQLAAKIYF